MHPQMHEHSDFLCPAENSFEIKIRFLANSQ